MEWIVPFIMHVKVQFLEELAWWDHIFNFGKVRSIFFLTHFFENYLMLNISSRCNIMGTCANTKVEYDLKGLNSKKLIRRKMTNTSNFSPWCILLLYESCLRPPSSCFTKWQILQFHDLFQCWMLWFFVVLCLLKLHPTLVSW